MKLINTAIEKPKKVIWTLVGITLLLCCFIPLIKIDTDPENMLSEDEHVRVMHNKLKKDFQLHDMLVIGIVNENHPQGVFNAESIKNVHELSKFVYELQEETSDSTSDFSFEGVIKKDLMAPSYLDHMAPGENNSLRFEYLIGELPKNDTEALAIKDKLLSNEMYLNTLVSENGKMLCLYVPLTSKDISYKISNKIEDKISSFDSDDVFHITGLPVAEDTFGIEMFIQMAISAPAAMLLIFILMLLFFKKFKLVLSPLAVAMMSVMCTMGLLIGTGNTVHIMSSMIPIFIMPIAVLDSVHILSEFFDHYPHIKNRKATIQKVIKDLFKPMLFTSLTSAAGFASLAITPIPPVRIFGIFVAIGILLAWLFTMLFVPAYIMRMDESSFESFTQYFDKNKDNWLSKTLDKIKALALNHSLLVLGALAIVLAAAIYGITKIRINDNPVKWFTKNHKIRVADRTFNENFAGSYMAYLSLNATDDAELSKDIIAGQLVENFQKQSLTLGRGDEFNQLTSRITSSKDAPSAFLDEIYEKADAADDDAIYEFWENIAGKIELMDLAQKQVFKNPKLLNYLLDLEKHLMDKGAVGKISSLSTIVKKVNKELNGGGSAHNKIPDNFAGVGQSILSFQNSHTPHHLNHFVTPDYRSANLWLQLKSGDNIDMENTLSLVEDYLESNPPPVALSKEWFGLTYINVIWQKKMVKGMLESFLGSFIVVLLMMTLLFRSLKWGLLSMIPLSLTILIIYGVIGLVGKDYDMPVAVLSALALGLAIDFAIHFLVRSREINKTKQSFTETMDEMYKEPARAISRNVIVIAVGFLPLLLATLIPYRTVGLILASILVLSGIITLVILPICLKYFRMLK